MVSPPAGRVYQVWVMSPSGARSAGLMAGAGTLLASAVVPGDRIGITVEPAGGTSKPDHHARRGPARLALPGPVTSRRGQEQALAAGAARWLGRTWPGRCRVALDLPRSATAFTRSRVARMPSRLVRRRARPATLQ